MSVLSSIGVSNAIYAPQVTVGVMCLGSSDATYNSPFQRMHSCITFDKMILICSSQYQQKQCFWFDGKNVSSENARTEAEHTLGYFMTHMI